MFFQILEGLFNIGLKKKKRKDKIFKDILQKSNF